MLALVGTAIIATVSGMELTGPVIIEEQTSTIVLHPGQNARVDEYLNLEVTLSQGE